MEELPITSPGTGENITPTASSAVDSSAVDSFAGNSHSGDSLAVETPPVAPSDPVEQERVPVEAALAVGWLQLKSRFLLLSAVSTIACLVMVAPVVAYAVIRELANRNLFLSGCLLLLLVTVPLLYSLGRIKVSLTLVRSQPFNSDDFVNVAPWFFYYLVMFWCRLVLVSFASCFFVIPGVIVQTRLDFAEYFIVDKHQNPFNAMASSWRITKGATMMLVLFSAVRFIIDWFSCLALLIGGIPARWMTQCAQSFIYDRLCKLAGVSEVLTAPLATAAPAAVPMANVLTSTTEAVSENLSPPAIVEIPGAHSNDADFTKFETS
jgi:hypothetical protein